MEGLKLKEDILNIKGRLDKVEEDLNNQINELNLKEQKWVRMDSLADQIKAYENGVVKFNICGKTFMTKVATLLNTKDTLFYKFIVSREVDLTKEIFFDRDPKYFGIILDFLRTKRISLKRFNTKEVANLRREAKYFEINEILDQFGETPGDLEVVGFEVSGTYISGGLVIGTNKLEGILESHGNSGIVVNSPGWILFELNYEWEITGIEVGGYKGNSSYWSSDNGSGASIKVSVDKSNWTNVGTIPSNFGATSKTVTFTPVKAKYIKFDYTSYLGIGFLKIIRN